MSFAITAVAVVGAGAAVGGSIISGNAAKKSANAQKQAYNSLQPLDASEISRVASQAELDRFTKSIASQQKLDPTFGSIRSTGGQNILSALNEDRSGNTVSDRALKESEATLADTKGSNSEVIAKLLDRVKADLDAGATLPPEFQAELVRSGLEGAGSAGLNLDGRAAGGTEVRKLLGREGIALKENREANARANLGAADELQRSRIGALSNLAQLDQAITQAKVSRAAGGIGVADAQMPKLGLSGADAAQIALHNNQLANAKILGAGSVDSNLAIQQGQSKAQIVGAVGSGLSTAAGAYGASKAAKDAGKTFDPSPWLRSLK